MQLVNEILFFTSQHIVASYIFVFVIALLFGSFFNVVIHRLPIMMENDWKSQCADLLQCESGVSKERYNLLTPNSTCPTCTHKIRWYENIPVLSYLIQGGTCSGCDIRISFQYPLVELLTACLAVYSLLVFDFTAQGVLAIIFCWLLIILAIIDLKTTYLPDTLNYILLWTGLLASTQNIFIDAQSSIIGAFFGYISLWSVYWLFKLVTGKESMGYGDFKLLAALGAWLGASMLPALIVISSVIGSVIGICLIVFRKHNSQVAIPFGPYLAIAGFICFFWGDTINHTFLGL